MRKKVFVDSNIWFYLLLQDDEEKSYRLILDKHKKES